MLVFFVNKDVRVNTYESLKFEELEIELDSSEEENFIKNNYKNNIKDIKENKDIKIINKYSNKKAEKGKKIKNVEGGRNIENIFFWS